MTTLPFGQVRVDGGFQFPVGKSHLDDMASLDKDMPKYNKFQFPVGKSHLDDAIVMLILMLAHGVSVPRREEPPR